MLDPAVLVVRSPFYTFIKLCLFGWLISISLGTTHVEASSPTQPVELHAINHAAVTMTPSASPTVIHNPTLFLPPAPQRISRLVLRLSERQLYGYQGEHQVASYPVAIGRDDWETPVGEFVVFQRQQNPAWEHPLTGVVFPPGPNNPLGARWLGFWTDGTNFIGFHGTPDEHLIGEAVSHGCVRMLNADVIELYAKVRLGTPVVVLP